jgi:hypothetical protein
MSGFGYTILNSGSLFWEDDGGGFFSQCVMNGTFVPVSGVNVYTINVTVTGCQDSAINGTNYSGLAATRSQTSTDDRLFFSVSNGSYSLYAEYQPF